MKNLVLLGLALSIVGCSKSSQPQNPEPTARPEATSSSGATPQPSANVTKTEAVSPAGGQGVKTEMRNVLFHLTTKAAAHIDTLSGELWPAGKNDMPVFDDKTSFEVRVANGKIWITTDALAEIMNRYVFAAKDAPLKDLSISIKDQKLDIKGKLHGKGDISFETSGTVTVNGDGRLRVHTEKVKALHVPVKGMMGLLGIELATVLNTSKIDGLDTDKNDLLMDLGGLLPPPHIRGKVTRVAVEGNRIVTLFGDGGKSAAAAAAQEKDKNYMSFQGNRVRFGKLTMENTDLLLLDLDPADPLDWNQDRYKDQLVAGYSKINSAFGLRSYVKDFAKLPRAGAPQPDTVPTD
ncbi:MAG TPA: hypothetical protein VGI13_12590 [Candidatus Acidoferrum sp.]|jgi:hypothetical protein